MEYNSDYVESKEFLKNIGNFMKDNKVFYLTIEAFEQLCLNIEKFSAGKVFISGNTELDSLAYEINQGFTPLPNYTNEVLILSGIFSNVSKNEYIDRFFESDMAKSVFGLSTDAKQNQREFANKLTPDQRSAIYKFVNDVRTPRRSSSNEK